MPGAKIEQAKEAAILALSRLSPQDRVSVVAFDHRVEVPVPAGPFENFEEMKRRIEAIRPGGQTAIYAAVRQAGQSVAEAISPDRISRVILMSDGQANVGPSSPAELEQLGRELGSQGIAVTTIGLGLDYSEELMTRMALAATAITPLSRTRNNSRTSSTRSLATFSRLSARTSTSKSSARKA